MTAGYGGRMGQRKLSGLAKCQKPGCGQMWAMPLNSEGTGYHREPLAVIAIRMASHHRDAHGDEAAALRAERWAMSTAPGEGERRPVR